MRRYTVCVHKEYTIDQLDRELSEEGGSTFVPERKAEAADTRVGNPRQTDWFLTLEEAKKLRDDERVLFVIESNTTPPTLDVLDEKIDFAQFWAYDSHDKAAYPNPTAGLHVSDEILQVGDIRNSGLYIHSDKDQFNLDPLNTVPNDDVERGGDNNDGVYHFPAGDYDASESPLHNNAYEVNIHGTNSHMWTYDGEGIDFVMIDSGIVADHPEFLDENNVSRVQQIDWHQETGIAGVMSPDVYHTDASGHGTHVASIACGKKHGWAKKAKIFCVPYADIAMDSDITTANKITMAFDMVLAWHSQKTNGRPTVLNVSLGIRSTEMTTPWKYNYRGESYDEHFKKMWQDGDARLDDCFKGMPLKKLSDGSYIWSDDPEVADGTYRSIHVIPTVQGKVSGEVDASFDNAQWNENRTVRSCGLGVGTSLNRDINFGHYREDIDEFARQVNGFNLSQTKWNRVVDGGLESEAMNTLVDQCIDAGIHVVLAAGNENSYQDVELPEHNKTNAFGGEENCGQDWNNYETNLEHYSSFDDPELARQLAWQRSYQVIHPYKNEKGVDLPVGTQNHERDFYTSRPPAPYSPRAFNVGSIGAAQAYFTTTKHHRSRFSNFGAATNIWACGDTIVAAASVRPDDPDGDLFFYSPYETDVANHPEKEGWKNVIRSGTSMAAPQVAGIACLYLQQDPSLTPDELLDLMIREANTDRHMSPNFDYTKNNGVDDDLYRHKESPYDVYHHYTGASFQNDSVAGSRAVVVAPKSGIGSMTIENSSSTQDSTKKVSILSKDVFDNADISVSNGDVIIKFLDQNGATMPLTGLSVRAKVSKIENDGAETYTTEFDAHSSGEYTHSITNFEENYPYVINAIVGNYELPELITGSVSGFTMDSTTFNVGDNSEANQVIVTITADVPNTIFSLSGADAAAFTLDSSTGVLTLLDAPDDSVKSSYSITVSGEHPISGFVNSVNLTINVVDLTPPTFAYLPNANATLISHTLTPELLTINIVEEYPIGTYVGNIIGQDEYPVTLSIVDNSLPSQLSQSYQDGQTNSMRLDIAQKFDFETQTEYNFVVRATDSNGIYADLPVKINVLDWDEEAPILTSPLVANEISENVNYGDAVLYTATANEEVTFSIVSGDGHVGAHNDTYFNINPTNGEMTLKQVLFNYESPDVVDGKYSVWLMLNDTANNKSWYQIEFPIKDVFEDTIQWVTTDIHPDANDSIFATLLTLPEDTASGTVLIELQLQNSTQGNTPISQSEIDDANYTFTVSRGDSDLVLSWNLTADGKAQLKYESGLDFETYSSGEFISLNLTYTIQDVYKTASKTLILTAGNVDDTPPEFTGVYTYNDVDRNNISFTAQANDDISDITSNPVTFSIGTDPIGWANIDANTGEVTRKAQANLDSYESVNVTIIATDASGNSASKLYTLNFAPLVTIQQEVTVTKYSNYPSGYSTRYGYYLTYAGAISPQNCFISGNWDEHLWIAAMGGINNFEASFTGQYFSNSTVSNAFSTVKVYNSDDSAHVTFNSDDMSFNSYFNRMAWSINSQGGMNNAVYSNWRSAGHSSTFKVEWE